MFFAHICLNLLLEGVVIDSDAVSQLSTNVYIAVKEGRGRLLLNHAPTEGIYIDQAVGCLQRCSMTAKGLLEYDIFRLNAHINVIKAPPHILLSVIDEGVVVAALSCAVVDQDSVQVVCYVSVVTKGCSDLVFFLLNLLRDRRHLMLNGMLVGGQYIRCID